MVLKKRLSIKLAGHDYITAWENDKKKTGSKEPDYKGDGIAVWIHEYEEKPKGENLGE